MSDTGGFNYYGTCWKCEKCGMYIPNGQTHACPTQPRYWPAYNYVFSVPDNGILERIAKALEEMSDQHHTCPICGKVEALHDRTCPKDEPTEGQPALKEIQWKFCDNCKATTCVGCPLEKVGEDTP